MSTPVMIPPWPLYPKPAIDAGQNVSNNQSGNRNCLLRPAKIKATKQPRINPHIPAKKTGCERLKMSPIKHVSSDSTHAAFQTAFSSFSNLAQNIQLRLNHRPLGSYSLFNSQRDRKPPAHSTGTTGRAYCSLNPWNGTLDTGTFPPGLALCSLSPTT
jgi:hypothetical protein